MESLTCPKCRGAMRTYERSGVTVDQCGECRGIFLDRGELERLVDAELKFNAPAQPRYEEKRTRKSGTTTAGTTTTVATTRATGTSTRARRSPSWKNSSTDRQSALSPV